MLFGWVCMISLNSATGIAAMSILRLGEIADGMVVETDCRMAGHGRRLALEIAGEDAGGVAEGNDGSPDIHCDSIGDSGRPLRSDAAGRFRLSGCWRHAHLPGGDWDRLAARGTRAGAGRDPDVPRDGQKRCPSFEKGPAYRIPAFRTSPPVAKQYPPRQAVRQFAEW
jgi:hypothetical protein